MTPRGGHELANSNETALYFIAVRLTLPSGVTLQTHFDGVFSLEAHFTNSFRTKTEATASLARQS